MSDDESRWVWPTGAKILHYRALVRRGLARETTGTCEGCASRRHRPGTEHVVPVFEVLAPTAADR